MSEIAYKVFIVDDEDGECCSSCVTGWAKVVYPLGDFAYAPEWLAREGYHLLCYESLEDALRFAEDWVVGVEVWECECEERTPLPVRNYIDEISEGRFYPNKYLPDWPKGTVMYKRVKRMNYIEIETEEDY